MQYQNTMILLTSIGLAVSMIGVATMIYVEEPLTTAEYLEGFPYAEGETIRVTGQITDNVYETRAGSASAIQLDGIVSFQISNQLYQIPNEGDNVIVEVIHDQASGIVVSWEYA